MCRLFVAIAISCLLSASFTPPARAQQLEAEGFQRCDLAAMPLLALATRANGGDAPLADSTVHASLRYTDDAPGQPITLVTKGANATWIHAGDRKVVLASGKTERFTNQGLRRVGHDPNAPFRQVEHLPVLLLKDAATNPDSRCLVSGIADGAVSLRIIRLPQAGPLHEALIRNSTTEVHFQPDTLLITRISFVMVSTTDWRRTIPVEIVFEDYRHVNGIKVPFRQKKYLAGQLYSELTLTDAAFDIGLTDADFIGGAR